MTDSINQAPPAILSPADLLTQIKQLEIQNATLARTNKYLAHKLSLVVPVFQECRDALCALSLAQITLRNISPSLATRADAAGTYSRKDFERQYPEPLSPPDCDTPIDLPLQRGHVYNVTMPSTNGKYIVSAEVFWSILEHSGLARL